MNRNVTVTGMVLTVMPIGEYDKRITILTLERGKITAFARGARRQGSQLLAACNPFSFGKFEVYEGRTSYNVVRAEISSYFTEVTGSLEATYYGFYFLEMSDYYSQENGDEKEVLKLLYQSLRALGDERYDKRLVRAVFELKMLVLQGIYPNMFSCQKCGKKEPMAYFSLRRAGMVCGDCLEGEACRRLAPSTVYTMQYIIVTEIPKLFTFVVKEEVLAELTEVLRAYMNQYVAHDFKSERFLHELL